MPVLRVQRTVVVDPEPDVSDPDPELDVNFNKKSKFYNFMILKVSTGTI
jgi:hypothetical protein